MVLKQKKFALFLVYFISLFSVVYYFSLFSREENKWNMYKCMVLEH